MEGHHGRGEVTGGHHRGGKEMGEEEGREDTSRDLKRKGQALVRLIRKTSVGNRGGK